MDADHESQTIILSAPANCRLLVLAVPVTAGTEPVAYVCEPNKPPKMVSCGTLLDALIVVTRDYAARQRP